MLMKSVDATLVANINPVSNLSFEKLSAFKVSYIRAIKQSHYNPIQKKAFLINSLSFSSVNSINSPYILGPTSFPFSSFPQFPTLKASNMIEYIS